MYACGYMGKVLHMDLITKEIKIEKLSAEIAKDYIGSAGFEEK